MSEGYYNTMNKDNLWIVEHFSELVTKYPGKYIAVAGEEISELSDQLVVGALARQGRLRFSA